MTYNTGPVLVWIKNWKVWYTEHYSMSTCMEVTNFQKTIRFFGPPCIYSAIDAVWQRWLSDGTASCLLHCLCSSGSNQVSPSLWKAHWDLSGIYLNGQLLDYGINSLSSSCFHFGWFMGWKSVACHINDDNPAIIMDRRRPTGLRYGKTSVHALCLST